MSGTRSTRSWSVAGIIVAVGWAVAIRIIVLATPAEADPLEEYRASKQYEASVERIGGKSVVFASELNEALASLFRGARLGYTIGFTSLAVAAVYLALSRTSRKEKPAR